MSDDEVKQVSKSVSNIFMTCWNTHDVPEFFNNLLNRFKRTQTHAIRFLILGPLEETEENKKPHYHAYVEFNYSTRWSTINKLFPSELFHTEKSENADNSIMYAIKHGEPIIVFGERKQPGQRTDLIKLRNKYDTSEQMIESQDFETYCKYKRGFDAAFELKSRKSRMLARISHKPIQVEYHFGKTGTGKTYFVDDIANDDIDSFAYIDFLDNGFITADYIELQKVKYLVWNEWRDTQTKFSDVLAYLENKKAYNIKNNVLYFPNVEKIYITSSVKPENLYKNKTDEDRNQLFRRLTTCIEHFKTDDGIYSTREHLLNSNEDDNF